MKSAALLFLLPMVAGMSVQAEEISYPGNRSMTAPFTGKMLDAFLAKSPPPIVTSRQYNLGVTSCKASVWYEGRDGPTPSIRPSTMMVPWTVWDSIENLQPKFSPAEGIYILHDKDGRVAQAWSELVVADIERQPKILKVTIWKILDTRYGGRVPGGRTPLPNKKPVWGWVTTEVARDEAKGMLETLNVLTDLEGDLTTTRTVFNHTPKRTLLTTEEYSGPEVNPEKLRFKQSYQRVYWPQGPGVRQMIQSFQKDAAGTLAPTQDVDEYWKVSPKGVRTLDKRENKLLGE